MGLEIDTVSGYVMCEYITQLWLAFVLEVDTEDAEVKFTFCTPMGHSINLNRVLVNQETEKPETKRNETGHAHLSMRST